MPASTAPTVILSRPGIQRDGTAFDAEAHTDGQWVRWNQRGRAQKMNGFRGLSPNIMGLARGLYAHPHDNTLYVLAGSQDLLQQFTLNMDTGVITVAVDRTPAGFATSDNNMWHMAEMYDGTVGGTEYILAHAHQTALDIASDDEKPAYYGENTAATALTAIADSEVSGGLTVFQPYLILYGSDGLVINSVPNDPLDVTGAGSNAARVTRKKIVRGMPMRGGAGQAPAGLLWSLDSLIRATFAGGSTVFDYDTISGQTDILAEMSVVELDGVFYWVGVGRFLMFNGVVQQIPNSMNRDWFFENLNWTYRNKVFGWTVPAWGEIWWAYPRGDATEPTHAVIYNIYLRTWYDTELPEGGRVGASSPLVYQYPLVAGADTDNPYYSDSTYIWQHEYGWDDVSGNPTRSNAIRSYFQTADMSLLVPGAEKAGVDRHTFCDYIEPDFVQSGDMLVRIAGRANAKAATTYSDYRTIVETPATPEEQVVMFRETRRQMSMWFESNTAGGYFKQGRVIAHLGSGTGRKLGAVA